MATVYRWTARSQLFGADAQRIGEHLEQLRRDQAEQQLTAEVVVEDARDPSAPTHKCFEWDDTEAAKQHRLNQARYVLRCIVTEVDVPGGKGPVSTRAFVRTIENNESGYNSVQVVLDSPSLREQVLAQALSELRAWQRKYSTLGELVEVFRAVDRLWRERKGEVDAGEEAQGA